MLVLDTNIVIAYFAEEESVVQALEEAAQHGEELIIPTIVKAETLSYADLDEMTLERMRVWFESTPQAVLDSNIADRAAHLRRAHRLRLIDAVIAATAVVSKAKLVSRDKDLKRVSELEVLVW